MGFLSTVTARSGQDVTLDCQKPSYIDGYIVVLEWSEPAITLEDFVFLYTDRPNKNHQHDRFKGRVELKHPSINVDASVIIKNVTVEDTGIYVCRIITADIITGRGLDATNQSINLTVINSG